MKQVDTQDIFQFINIEKYPLHLPESELWQQVVSNIKTRLQSDGCAILKNFIKLEAVEQLKQEGQKIAPSAYTTIKKVNAYNINVDETLPEDHPAHITFERGNSFVAKDQIPENYIIQKIYANETFKKFVAECFEKNKIYELADPLAALCLNVLEPGRSHPWHFDTNEFTVSLLTQSPEEGGQFQYCPNIRSKEHENLDQVRKVITEEKTEYVKSFSLQQGDLQFFKGRYSLHRVSPVNGNLQRHTAIFAYTEKPGVIGNIERTRQLFGRVLPEHYKAQEKSVRSDTLLD